MSRLILAIENFNVYIHVFSRHSFFFHLHLHFSFFFTFIYTFHLSSFNYFVFIQSYVMSLLFFIDNQIFQISKFMMLWFNRHVAFEKYVVVLACFKKNKKNFTRQIWIQCDRDRKSSIKNEKQYNFNKRCNCSFKCTTTLMNEFFWYLKVVVSNHNHELSLIDVYSIQRKIVLKEHKFKISH